MNLEIDGFEVLKIEEVVTATQTAIIKTHYDFLKHTEIIVPEQCIVGEQVQIKVICKDYLGTVLASETTPIIVEVSGVQQSLNPINGEILFPFSSELTGDFAISTAMISWRNDSKTIKVV